MRRATTFAIAALLFCAIGTLAHGDGEGLACGSGESFDQVTPPVLPPGWTAFNAIDPDGILWQTSDSGDPSPPAIDLPNSAWVNDPDTISDKYLYWTPGFINSPEHAVLIFANNYALEEGFDGGVLEISVDGGPFEDIITAGGIGIGYNGMISTCCGNPLAGRQAWTGNSGGFVLDGVDLKAFVGHTISLRWRMGSDSSGSGGGWRIDDISIQCEGPTPTPPPTPPITPTPTPTATPRPVPTPRLRPTPPPRPTPSR